MNIITAIKAGNIAEDIANLKSYIQDLEQLQNDPIKALYIITENDIRLEIKKKFSIETSNEILDLLLKSRKTLLARFESELTELH